MAKPSAQPDLFDLFAPIGATGEPPVTKALGNAEADPVREAGLHGGSPVAAEELRHLIVATLTRASTACGIEITDYQFMARFGTAIEDGRKVLCTHYAYDGTVSCVRCLEEMRG